MVEANYGRGYRIDGELEGQQVRFDSRGGGLLRDVIEEVGDDPDLRSAALAEHLETRAELIEPGHGKTPPLEPAEDDDGEPDVEEPEGL